MSRAFAFMAGVWLGVVALFVFNGVPGAEPVIERAAAAIHGMLFLLFTIFAMEDV